MSIYDNLLGGYVYTKHAIESPETGESKKLYITYWRDRHLSKLKNNMPGGGGGR